MKRILLIIFLSVQVLLAQQLDIKCGLGVATAHTPKMYHSYIPKFHHYNAIGLSFKIAEYLRLQTEIGIFNTGFRSNHPKFSINQVKGSFELGLSSIFLKEKLKFNLLAYYATALPVYVQKINGAYFVDRFKAKYDLIPIKNDEIGLSSQISWRIKENQKSSWYVFLRSSYGLSSVYFNYPFSNSKIDYAWTRNVTLSTGVMFLLKKATKQ